MNDQDRDNLIGNIVGHLSGAQRRIQLRQCAIFYKADVEYGTRVAEGLKLDLEVVKSLSLLSHGERAEATLKEEGETVKK
jgi:catalase